MKLRVFGDPRYSGDYTTRITYPHCSIEKTQVEQEGQLSLPIPELRLLPPSTNPVVLTLPMPIRRQKSKMCSHTTMIAIIEEHKYDLQ